jgi:uncharacterized cofD-like protein
MGEDTKIVSIGGGPGLSNFLRGLKKRDVELSAIVAVTEDGGSSGRLREELGLLPPGDIRNCMVALSEDEALMSRLFRHRFSSQETDGGLNDHSFGNLFVTAMAGVTGDFAEAVRLTSEVLAIKGTICPSTKSNVALKALLADGEWIDGETRITADLRRICRVALVPPDAHSLPEALEAIATAQIITFGPGSLYTSLIANLLPLEIVSAIRASGAHKIYVQNIMTQPAETTNMTMGDHIQAITDHVGHGLFPNVLMNTLSPLNAILRKYSELNAHIVEADEERVRNMGITIVKKDLIFEGDVIRHDAGLFAEAVLETCRN